MDSITVENFRCFGEKQAARLAPLTLLVGDNSTGKTSFLALIRALWDVAYREVAPDFQEHPYDLGSYMEIVNSSAPNGSAVPIEAQFEDEGNSITSFFTAFGNREGAPYPFKRRVQRKDRWMELSQDSLTAPITFNYGDAETQDKVNVSDERDLFAPNLIPLSIAAFAVETPRDNDDRTLSMNDRIYRFSNFSRVFRSEGPRPYCSAPIRSRPARTYDPIAPSQDSEGRYVPTFLARSSMHGGEEWEELRNDLVDFGRISGLFDDLVVKHLGDTEGSPFQIHVRKHGESKDAPYRNLVDMGYGISQALPILTEMLRPDGPTMFLLQQPEVHLHPSAQAALGSLFCKMATAGKQIIVETHSEYIVDRIRMDVRDGATELTPNDVSVLYFERSDQSVTIHSISFDDDGDLVNAPSGYGQFFMDEVNRSLGI